MVSHATHFAIALERVDESVVDGNEIYEELEQASNAIAPDPLFDFIHPDHQEFAIATAREFNSSQVERIQNEMRQGRQILEAKERLTRRKEFSQWKQSLSATAADIRKKVKLVLTFSDFPIEKIVAIASAVNIYTLCAPRFALVVEKLRELPVLAADRIKQMVKESRPARSPKQQQESSIEWQRDLSGGSRHLSINLYDDELAVEIKSVAEERQITAQKAIAEAFRKSKLVEQAQRERREAIAEVKEKQIELQKENIRLNDIVQQQNEYIQGLKAQVAVPRVQSSANLVKEAKPAIYIEDFNTWEELAEAVNSESDRFVAVTKLASDQERSKFAQLLSQFCERKSNALDRIDWVPPRFLDSALRYLSFSVQQFTDTSPSEEPVFEDVSGCKFVSLKNFGVPGERWVFQLPDGRNVPIFERSRFAIEKF